MVFAMATHNQHKLEELRRILEPMEINVIPAEYDEVEETGTTFCENACLKAAAACKIMGMPTVADDSGIVVDALNGAPGVYSARYGGEGLNDAQRTEKLLQELENIPQEKRTARFVSAICCVFPDGRKIEVQGECEGFIALKTLGTDGFGYDPVFLVGSKTYAQMTAEEKDAVSHRGKALRLLEQELKKQIGTDQLY